MKRNGFTLIELLTIICILGVIILIAVPNITKLVAETKKKIFNTSSTNLIKTMEEECKSNLITKDRTTLSYSIINGKIDSNLDVKGTTPDDGYVILDNKCNVKYYYLKYEDFVFSNGEDIRQDYMLKAPTEENTSILKTLYPSYYDNIVTVNFINNITVPEGAIEVKDPSVSGGGKIKSWLIEDSSKYNLYVGSEGIIFGNYDSQYLFANLISVTNFNFINFNTSFVNNMKGMFSNCNNLIELDLSMLNVSSVTDMSNMFTNAKNIIELNLTGWDTSNVTTMVGMFHIMEKVETILGLSEFITSKVENMASIFNYCRVISSLDLSYWDVSNVTSLEKAFYECPKLVSISFENWNTSNVTNMSHLFSGDNSLETINVSKWDTSNVVDMTNTFAYLYKMSNLNVSNWDTSKVKNFTWIFYNMPCWTTADLTNWSFESAEIYDKMFYLFKSNTIVFKDADAFNKVGKYLPDRTTTTSGTLVIKGDTTGIDKSAVEALNWQVYDKDGNQL